MCFRGETDCVDWILTGGNCQQTAGVCRKISHAFGERTLLHCTSWSCPGRSSQRPAIEPRLRQCYFWSALPVDMGHEAKWRDELFASGFRLTSPRPLDTEEHGKSSKKHGPGAGLGDGERNQGDIVASGKG